eukprot:220513-Hanusia_phi.AAC.1
MIIVSDICSSCDPKGRSEKFKQNDRSDATLSWNISLSPPPSFSTWIDLLRSDTLHVPPVESVGKQCCEGRRKDFHIINVNSLYETKSAEAWQHSAGTDT